MGNENEFEEIELYIQGRKEPIAFVGKYLGQKLPYGKPTENWHYYQTKEGRYIHCRKEHLQIVISSGKIKLDG